MGKEKERAAVAAHELLDAAAARERKAAAVRKGSSLAGEAKG